jgi:hypothetical protein
MSSLPTTFTFCHAIQGKEWSHGWEWLQTLNNFSEVLGTRQTGFTCVCHHFLLIFHLCVPKILQESNATTKNCHLIISVRTSWVPFKKSLRGYHNGIEYIVNLMTLH